MPAKFNVSPARVGRIWQSHRSQPHRIESFKFSTDPQFAAKAKDVVGLYLNPPRCYRGTSVIEQGDPADAAAPLKSCSPPRLP